MKGCYCLVLRLDSETSLRTRGRGFTLAPGVYVYCGSALSSLDARINRHVQSALKGNAERFWHIDFLLPRSSELTIVKAETASRMECGMANLLKKKGMAPVSGFGSSDCGSGCGGHLLLSRTTSMYNAVREAGGCFKQLNLNPEVLRPAEWQLMSL